MITISTGDLTGVLADVIPFGHPDEDLPMLNAVRVEWDGDRLHALSTDRYRIAWSTWDPDDDPDGETQDDLFTDWGGADEPWAITVPLGDAKDLVRNFKLSPKEARCPLSVDYTAAGRLKVARSRDTGFSALTAIVDGRVAGAAEFPNLRKHLAEADRLEMVTNVAYTPRYLADFAKVRPRGSLQMRFTSSLTHVQIGERFTGAIMPVKLGDEKRSE